MELQAVLDELKAQYNPDNLAGMARFGVNTEQAYGVPVKTLRQFKKRIGRDHVLASQLWDSGIHEARILASLIDDPKQVTEAQISIWVQAFDSWDLCDLCCNNLFDKTPFAHAKAVAWSSRQETFVKRASFVLMATRAVHDKEAEDRTFIAYLSIIEREAADERNYVKKAVNWALRQIGKRNPRLNQAAIETARRIQAFDSKAARWVASDALRELTSQATQARLLKKQS